MDRRYGGRVMEGARPTARERVMWRPGPIAVALFLALVSTPLAALSIWAVSTGTVNSPRQPVDYLDAVLMALVAVLVAGLVAGALGGAIARHWPVAGLVVAVFVAWPVAIALLPLTAAVLGFEYGGVWICIDGCFPWIRDDTLTSGIGAYLSSFFLEAFGPLEVGVLLLGIGFVFSLRGHRVVAAGLGLAGFVAVNWWTIAPAGFGSWPYGVAAAAALVSGAAVWILPMWPWRRSTSAGRATSAVEVP
jgi:hypothetical protein